MSRQCTSWSHDGMPGQYTALAGREVVRVIRSAFQPRTFTAVLPGDRLAGLLLEGTESFTRSEVVECVDLLDQPRLTIADLGTGSTDDIALLAVRMPP